MYVPSGIALAATALALALPQGPGFWIAWVARTAALAWLLLEALRWRAALERRVRLGLVKPAVLLRMRRLALAAAFALFASAAAPALARALG